MSSPTEPTRLTTRELAGPTLIFLATFLLAVTIAAPLFLADRFTKISLDTDTTTVAQSTDGARFLDACALDAPVAVVRTQTLLTGQRVVAVRPSDANLVTLQAGTSIRIADDKALGTCGNATVAAYKDRVTLDRRTAHPVANPMSQVQFDSNRPAVGLTTRHGATYILPTDAASGLNYFDVTTRQSVPLVPQGDANVDGLDAKRFTATIPDVDLSTLKGVDGRPEPGTIITRPASWFGPIAGVAPNTPLTAALHRSAKIVLAVDPKTGLILDSATDITQEYRILTPGDNPALASHRLTSIAASFSYDRDTQRAMVDAARAQSRPQLLWGRIIPLISGILGVLMLIVGVVLTLNPRQRVSPTSNSQ